MIQWNSSSLRWIVVWFTFLIFFFHIFVKKYVERVKRIFINILKFWLSNIFVKTFIETFKRVFIYFDVRSFEVFTVCWVTVFEIFLRATYFILASTCRGYKIFFIISSGIKGSIVYTDFSILSETFQSPLIVSHIVVIAQLFLQL